MELPPADVHLENCSRAVLREHSGYQAGRADTTQRIVHGSPHQGGRKNWPPGVSSPPSCGTCEAEPSRHERGCSHTLPSHLCFLGWLSTWRRQYSARVWTNSRGSNSFSYWHRQDCVYRLYWGKYLGNHWGTGPWMSKGVYQKRRCSGAHLCSQHWGGRDGRSLGLLASNPGLLGKFKEREGALPQKTKKVIASEEWQTPEVVLWCTCVLQIVPIGSTPNSEHPSPWRGNISLNYRTPVSVKAEVHIDYWWLCVKTTSEALDITFSQECKTEARKAAGNLN